MAEGDSELFWEWLQNRWHLLGEFYHICTIALSTDILWVRACENARLPTTHPTVKQCELWWVVNNCRATAVFVAGGSPQFCC